MIILAFALQIFIIIQVIWLDSDVERLKKQLLSHHTQLENQSVEIKNDIRQIKQEIAKASSIIRDAYTESGEIDIKTLQFPLTFCVIPKEYTENTKVFIYVNGEEIELKNEQGTFKKTINADAREYYDVKKVSIENNGLFQNDDLKYANLSYNIKLDQIFPQINVIFGYSSESERFSNEEKTTIRYSGDIDVYLNVDVETNNYKIKKIACIITNDGEIAKTIPLRKINEDFFTEYINQSFEVDTNKNLEFKLVAELEEGYVYESVFERFKATLDNKHPEPEYKDFYIIKDKDGKIIYDSKE